jgi:hypothetical protein
MKGSFFDSTVHRIYACENSECEAKIHCEETVKDPWQKVCPFCNQESLILESANLAAPAFIDLKQPKTVGSLGEKNYEKAVKEGKKTGVEREGRTPFWRKNKKINYNVLKNPNKYINTGYT